MWGKPGKGVALTSWLIGPPVVNLAPTNCTSYTTVNLTRALCTLHQSTWLSTQPLTFVRQVGCMCIVPGPIPKGGWEVPTQNAWVVVSWGTVSSDGWTGGKKSTTSWGLFLNSHFFTNPAQHFFPATSIVNWASHAFPKMWSLMIVLTWL
jgi:hypothetical protein